MQILESTESTYIVFPRISWACTLLGARSILRCMKSSHEFHSILVCPGWKWRDFEMCQCALLCAWHQFLFTPYCLLPEEYRPLYHEQNIICTDLSCSNECNFWMCECSQLCTQPLQSVLNRAPTSTIWLPGAGFINFGTIFWYSRCYERILYEGAEQTGLIEFMQYLLNVWTLMGNRFLI